MNLRLTCKSNYKGGAMVRVYGLVGCLAALMAGSSAKAVDLPMLSVAQRQRPGFDWSGWHVGGHVGYAAGWSDWSASQPAGGGGRPEQAISPAASIFLKAGGGFFVGFRAENTA